MTTKLFGSSEMAERIRTFNWSETSLGPIEGWASPLCIMLTMVLDNPLPTALAWGSDLITLHNDAYCPLLGDKPNALGYPFLEVWGEARDTIAPQVAEALTGKGTRFEGTHFTFLRRDRPEEAFFDYSFSPVRDENGMVVGILNTATGITNRLLAERWRAEADKVLPESETRFRAFVMASSDVVYRMSPDWSQMHQLDGQGFLADTVEPRDAWLEHYIALDDQPEVEAAIRHAIRTKSLFELEHRVRRIDGSLGWTLSRAVPIQDKDGEIIEWLGAARDITMRKQAETALRESEERLRQFGEASQDILWVRDTATLQWTYLTPAFETIYGLSRDEALSGDNYRSWLDLIVLQDRQPAIEAIDRVQAGEQVAFEYRIRRPADGTIRWLRNTDFPMWGPNGTVEQIGGVGHDVTEFKRIEAALRDEEARQRALIEGVPQLVWRANAEGQWTWSSPQWRSYTGQSEEQSYSWGWLDVLHPDDRQAAHDAWRKAERDGMLRLDCRISHAESGQYRWFQVRGVPVRSDGQPGEWVGSCTDINDQMQARVMLKQTGDELERRVAERTDALMAAEASLRQVQKMDAVGQLASGIAHDFNNMLQGISGSLEMASSRIERKRLPDAIGYLGSARDIVQRAAALSHRLLAFSRQQTLEAVPVELDDLVHGVAEMIRRTVGSAIEVEARLSDGQWLVLCDRSQMENALLNLCVNARDAMPDGGWLTILTMDTQLAASDLLGEQDVSPGSYVTISVTDTGTGMPPEVIARVFEPFYTTKPIGQGTGLGLAQVYGFVRQSGGFVRIDSAPGQGTTVRLFLPRYIAPDADEEAGTMSDVVLIVEDEERVRKLSADWLHDAGYRVLEAADGASALRLLRGGGHVDILVTDIGLPGSMNGRQVAEALRNERPGVPVLFMTGYTNPALRSDLPEGTALINKPFSLNELATRIGTMIETTKQRGPVD